MSRIGKKPIEVPDKVKVSIDGGTVRMEGPKGTLSFSHRPEVKVGWGEDEKSLVCSIAAADEGERRVRALWGTTRAILQNMIKGVSEGYQKQLEILGVGWGATVNGRVLEMSLGFAKPVKLQIPEGLDVQANKQQVIVSGADKQLVGQFAAQVRSTREPEPYNGKGVKYSDEVIRRKQGKQFGA